MTTIELEFTTNMMSNQVLGGGGGQAPQGVTVRIMQPGVPPSGGVSERDKPSTRTQKLSAFEHNEGFEVYKPNMFTITAYLPNDGREGEKRLKLQCYPGMTVQEVIDSQIPSVTHKPYVVYQFPSRALLNPEKEASMLQDQEIWIEPAHMFIQAEDSGDERLAVVRELFRTEDAYLEHLKNIFDIYIDPMRHWGVSQSDMNTLFVPLSRLCDLLMNFFSELELAVKSWNTNTTLIGGLFTQYPSYWEMYIEYAQSYTLAMNLLKQMKKDESFSKFLDIKRGAAMHTLESLMLLPVQRVSDYKRYLTQLLTLTHRSHPDYQNIRVTVARTEEIIQARADELLYLQNESRLEQVQLHFPNDELFLFEKLEMMDTSTPKRSRSVSHAQPPVSKTSSTGTPTRQKSNSHLPVPEHTDNHPVSSIPSYRKAQRLYILEGPVKLLGINKHQQQDRYLFLFSDLLIIAKPGKSRTQHQRVFKLKNRLRLSDVWVSESVHDTSSQYESAFTIGWPIVNYIALFSNPQLKELWYTSLLKQVNQQRQLSVSDSVSIRILNMIRSSSQQLSVSPTSHLPEFLQVHISENCLTVLSNALRHLKCTEPVSEFQLWVKLVKEDKEELLQGHECIFAIQSHHNRHQIDLNNDSNPQQLEFVVRRKPQHDITRTSSRSGLRRKIRMLKKKSYKPVKMFSVPLEDIIVNNQLPEKLQEMLIRLWVDGTTTSGIFRLNGNARKIREVKEAIDGRKSVDIADEGIHVISSLLKDLLRNVPGGILPSSRYTEFVATNDITDETTRIQQIRKVLGKLPGPNQVFLRYLLPLLHHIAQYEELNKMSTINLAICFAPSLLEPDYSLAVIKNEAPTLVEFMIRHSMEIYNNELPELFRQADIGPSEASESEREMGPVQYVKVKDDDTSGGGTLSSNGSRKYYHQRNLSMESTCTSASEDSFDEDDQSGYQHLSQADGNMTLLSTSSRGQVSLLSGSISTGVEGDMSDIEDDESLGGTYDRNKWPITTRQAPGVWSRPYFDAKSRRHSFVSQSISTKHYSPDLASSSILGAGGGVGGISPHSRSRNTSHGIGSPMFPHRVDHLDTETSRVGGGVMHSEAPTSNSGSSSSGSARKKRKKPGHSNSFSKSSDLPHIEPRIPQSTSFSYANDYDSLLPAAADSRPRSHTVATSSLSRPLTHSTGRDSLTSSLEVGGGSSLSGPGGRVSSAGITRSGGWNQQGLSSNRRSGSPDDSLAEFMNTPFSKLNPELIKQTISHRFNLTTTGGTTTTADKKSSPSPPAKEDIKSSRLKDSSETKKTTPSANKYSSYQQQSSPSRQKQMKRVESVDSTTASIDDRPEAERHLNSLPRSQNSTGSLGRRSMFATNDILSLGYNNQSESGSQLTIGSGAGYSSDTESSPSRTLNRPDKLSEVTGSPYTIPSRYSKYNNDNTPSPKPLESFDRPPSIEEHSLQKSLDESPRQSRSSLSYSTRESYVKKRSSLTSQSLSSKDRNSGGDWEQSDNDRNFTRSLQEPPTSGSSDKLLTLSSKSFDDKIGPMPAPHIGTRQLGSTLTSHDHKSRSMPGERNVTRKHTVESRGTGSVSYMKTERVVRYELPVPKKIRRINLRAYNNAK